MVKRLLSFIQASRSRSWLSHFKSAEELMLDFASMNSLKYRRKWPAYVPDMYDLQHRDPDVWAVFIRGAFRFPGCPYIVFYI